MKYHLWIAVALLGVLLTSCKKTENELIEPKITNDRVEVTSTSAAFTWMVEWIGKRISVVELSEYEDMSDSQFYGSEEEINTKYFSATANDLKPATKYYYRFWVWNQNYDNNRFVFEKKNFSTLSDLPIVKTLEVKNITRTSALLQGEVISDGGSEVTERGVCWDISHNPSINNNYSSQGVGIGEFTVSVSNLCGSTTYYVRCYAKNSMGIVYGNELCFTTEEALLPSVMTTEITEIARKTAKGGGEVTDDGGATITERGICWSTSHNPTISGYHDQNGTGTGSFSVNMNGLRAETTYYVRAYAINAAGTTYGDEVSFTTLSGAPIGAINGLFSIGATKKVYFSQGNLQYQASTNTWRFAPHQYNYIGSNNSHISQTYSGWIDLFGWGTSGWDNGNDCYQPWSTNNISGHIYGPRVWTTFGYNSVFDLTGAYANSDWGVFNMISNGGNISQNWRTLTRDEWRYVFDYRNTTSGIRYAKAIVCGVKGVVLLPDNWDANAYSLNSTNMMGIDFDSNIINATDWVDSFESFGAVFLPAAGYRYGEEPRLLGSYGCYWSASCVGSEKASEISFDESHLSSQQDSDRYFGESVRLVQDY